MSERSASSYRRSRFTPDHVRLLNLLSAAKIHYQAEDIPFERPGEFTFWGGQDRKPKAYWPDILLDQAVIVEVIGKGSSSLDPERRAFFASRGYYELDLPNKMVRDYPEQTGTTSSTCQTRWSATTRSRRSSW